MNHLIF
jgi:hypothetical protein